MGVEGQTNVMPELKRCVSIHKRHALQVIRLEFPRLFKKAIRHQCVQQSTPDPVGPSKGPGKLLFPLPICCPTDLYNLKRALNAFGEPFLNSFLIVMEFWGDFKNYLCKYL